MTKKQHKERHELLHKELDELLADFILHNPGKMVTRITMMEFMEWSFRQTVNPTGEKK